MIKIYQYSERYQGHSCFSGQVQVAQKSSVTKYIFNAVNSGLTLFLGEAQSAQQY